MNESEYVKIIETEYGIIEFSLSQVRTISPENLEKEKKDFYKFLAKLLVNNEIKKAKTAV